MSTYGQDTMPPTDMGEDDIEQQDQHHVYMGQFASESINVSHRRDLATALHAELTDAKFVKRDSRRRTKEEVWEFQTPADRIRLQVYTTIVNGETRKTGTDDIRVCAVYRNDEGKEFVIVKIAHVNRTGDIASICRRVRDCMRHVYLAVNKTKRCPRCGAPTFMTKKKLGKPSKHCCADLCWKKPDPTPSQVVDGTVEDDLTW